MREIYLFSQRQLMQSVAYNPRKLEFQELQPRHVLRMASAPLPLSHVGGNYTILTQVNPSSSASTTVQQNCSPVFTLLQQFLKGEPKALGTVQIMIGVLNMLLGAVLVVNSVSISLVSGIFLWGSIIYIIAGSLAVSASNKLNNCKVKAALGMNIFSVITAGIAIILISLDLVIGSMMWYTCYDDSDGSYGYRRSRCAHMAISCTNGIIGVLLVFSLLQFIISIVIAAFTCKATCINEPTLNVINVVPNTAGHVPAGSSFPIYPPQLNVSTLNAVPMNNPAEYPPAYDEKNPPENAGLF